MDNPIYPDEKTIAGVSDQFGAGPHRHPLLEIYTSCDLNSHALVNDETSEGTVIVIGTDAVHAISDRGKRGLAVLSTLCRHLAIP